jgi:hypothetical protein
MAVDVNGEVIMDKQRGLTAMDGNDKASHEG